MKYGRVDVLYGKQNAIYSYDVYMTEKNRIIFDGYGGITLTKKGDCFSMRNSSDDSIDIEGYVSLDSKRIFGFRWGNRALARPDFYVTVNPGDDNSWKGSYNLSNEETVDFFIPDPHNKDNKIKVHCQRIDNHEDVVMTIHFDC